MRVLIVVGSLELGNIWARHLSRNGAEVVLAQDQQAAIAEISANKVDMIIVDIVLACGSAIAIADYAGFRRPEAKVIFVSNANFFSDGSIFQHIPNACAIMPSQSSADDIEAVVTYHAAC